MAIVTMGAASASATFFHPNITAALAPSLQTHAIEDKAKEAAALAQHQHAQEAAKSKNTMMLVGALAALGVVAYFFMKRGQ